MGDKRVANSDRSLRRHIVGRYCWFPSLLLQYEAIMMAYLLFFIPFFRISRRNVTFACHEVSIECRLEVELGHDNFQPMMS